MSANMFSRRRREKAPPIRTGSTRHPEQNDWDADNAAFTSEQERVSALRTKLGSRKKTLRGKLDDGRRSFKDFRKYVEGGAGLNNQIRKKLVNRKNTLRDKRTDMKDEKNQIRTRMARLG